ncbi:hypothetical protein SETIT_2G055400v2 [Setaria italica]|uniref:Uncharacterized protein n=1 Tax=Setaria italica TaxID=4555 RepID=A0A368PVT4_SETIT|nr:hypothetical protein SETIT_2G055400v2 [Setaria italica]
MLSYCGSLIALPKGPLLVKQPFGGVETVCCRSAFPSLRKLDLSDLSALERWGQPKELQEKSALALWTCFAQLVDLKILDCDALVYWPQNVFQVLVCLRSLVIYRCSQLIGRTQAFDEQSALAPQRNGILPCLESLEIENCESLVEVPILPASLKTLCIFVAVVRISGCDNLQSLSGQQLDAVQELRIDSCSRLESLEPCLGDLRLLEELKLYGCRRLVSLPDGPQAYSSLRFLQIKNCDGIKLLPPRLHEPFGLPRRELHCCCTLGSYYKMW